MGGSEIADNGGDEERRHAPVSNGGKASQPFLDQRQTTQPDPDDDAHTVGDLVRDDDPGGLDGLRRRSDCEADEPVHPPSLARVDPFRDVEIADLARDPPRQSTRVEVRDRSDARSPGAQCSPVRLRPDAEGSHKPETRDDDPTHWAPSGASKPQALLEAARRHRRES